MFFMTNDHEARPVRETIEEDGGEYGEDRAECVDCGETISGSDENGWRHLDY